jgi:2,3-dihydroxybenzoate decarboxylase
MRKIDLEAHFLTREYFERLRARENYPKFKTIKDEKHGELGWLFYGPDVRQTFGPPSMRATLLELREGRIGHMDGAGIDMQVLSLCDPGCEIFDDPEATDLARRVNNELFEVTKRYPDRFIGLAALAPQNPGEAANELERSVRELGFRGAKINSNIRGEYLDDERYWPIFERAEKLGVPIYLHPMMPSISTMKAYTAYGGILAGPTLGYAADTALHAMRLICSGVFDKYPETTIILGHLGEGLPFWLNRMDLDWREPLAPGEPRPQCRKKPSEYLKTNFFVTTSGMFFQPALMCVYLALGADRIAFAVDHPFEDSTVCGHLMDQMPICETDREKICHLNAEKLLKIGA